MRHNADFEKAGQSSAALPPVPDKESTAQIKRANIERDLEVVNAIRMERKMMRRDDDEAKEYRKVKEEDNLKVSRGEVISHLAAMQRKSAEKEKARRKEEARLAQQQAEESAQENSSAQNSSEHSKPSQNGSLGDSNGSTKDGGR